MASITFRVLSCLYAVLLLSFAASATGTTGAKGDEIRAPGLMCFPVPARSSISCRVEVIPGISYTFWYSPPRSPSNLSDEQIQSQFKLELRQYQSIEITYRELGYLKDELKYRHSLSVREENALSEFEEKYRNIVSLSQAGNSKGISTQELHARLKNSLKVYEQNVARLERIRLLLNLMVSRRILGPEQSRDFVVFAQRYNLIHEADQAVVDEIKMSAEPLLDENQNLRNSLKDTAPSSATPTSATRPVLHRGVQLGSLIAKPSDESLNIAVPGNRALFTMFKPLTTYIVDDQAVYAIRLDVDSPNLNGFSSQMSPKTPEVQLIAREGALGIATWEVDVRADRRFGQAQLVFHGKLLRYSDEQSYARGDKPEETDMELPVRAVTLTPVPTKIETKLDHLLTWVEHFFGALGAPITFFLAVVSVYTNRAKIKTFWKWLSDKLASASRRVRKRLVRKKSDTPASPQSNLR